MGPSNHDTRQDTVIVERLVESLSANLSANQGLLAELVEQQRSITVSTAQQVDALRVLGDKQNYVFRIPDDTKTLLLPHIQPLLDSMRDLWDRTDSMEREMRNIPAHVSAELHKVYDPIQKELSDREKRIINAVVLRLSGLGGGLVALLTALVFILDRISNSGPK